MAVNPHAAELQAYYEAMSAKRNKIVWPLVIFTLLYFFIPTAIVYFTNWMDGQVVPGLSWGFLYVFTTFFYVVAATTYYRAQMAKVDAEMRPAEMKEAGK